MFYVFIYIYLRDQHLVLLMRIEEEHFLIHLDFRKIECFVFVLDNKKNEGKKKLKSVALSSPIKRNW